MLVLSRKVGEKILIGDNISVTVVRIGQGGVRIGIEAPADLEVVREELKAADATPDVAATKSRLGAPK
jgi:carbon storage regulator